MQQRQEAV